MIRVYPVPTGIVVRWQPLIGAQLRLDRAVHSADQYSPLADVTGRTFYLDRARLEKHFVENTFYRLVELTDEGEHVVGEARLLNLPDPMLQTVFERLQETARVHGTPALVAHVKVGGTPCPECFDPVQKKPTNPRCPVCYGTGFEGGYHEPVQTLVIKRIVKARGRKTTQPIIQTPEQAEFLILPDVPVSPKDLIIDLQDMAIYRINFINEVTERGFPLYQECQAKKLHLQAPEYSLFDGYMRDFRMGVPFARLKGGGT